MISGKRVGICYYTYSLELALFQVLDELLLVRFEILEFVGILFVLELVVIVPLGEWLVVVGNHVGLVSGLDGPSPAKLGDLTESVGKTFHVVTSKQLLVEVEEEFTTVFLEGSHLLTVHPERHIGVEVVVVSVKADVFSEVRQLLFVIFVSQPSGVVSVNGENIILLGDSEDGTYVLSDNTILHFKTVRPDDDIRVDEIEGVDFVGGREDDAPGVSAVEHSDAEGVDEHSFVEVEASPGSGLVESLEVLGVVEQMVESDGLLPNFVVVDGENLSPWKESLSVVREELLDGLHVLKK